MKIIDLTPEYEKQYLCCLEDWNPEIKEAGDHKACWYAKIKDKGLRVKLAQDDNGTIGGMIQYLPVELSPFEGKDLYTVLCIWVHGQKQGRGNYQKKGMGKALLKAAEEDVWNMGSKGMVAWGVIMPFFMRASWFKKQGYYVADKDGIMRLLWKPFTSEATPPTFIKQNVKHVLKQGKVTVTLFINGWCPAMNMTYERTKRAIEDFPGKVELVEYPTFDKDAQRHWGIADAIFIDDRQLNTGPPPSYKKIRRKIEKKVRLLKS